MILNDLKTCFLKGTKTTHNQYKIDMESKQMNMKIYGFLFTIETTSSS